ncbi:glycosyltransferase family 87 protein [Streptomyces sp. BI20]|uniref:glycosyltransferase family 87 protein n=1 Tax=Streptomyces sp. BI20 TaxID=3403460 RepID=UPI003C76A063
MSGRAAAAARGLSGRVRRVRDRVDGFGHRVLAWAAQPASRPWWAAMFAVVVGISVATSLRENWGSDNAFAVKAADALLAGESPYEDKRFLYLPSAVLLAVPEALVPTPVLRVLLPALVSGLVAVGWWASLRLLSVPARSRFAVVGFGVLAIGFKPYVNLVLIGNWTVLSAAALPVALCWAAGGRWGRAGMLLGLAVAAKPMLVPMAAVFLLARAWRGLAGLVLVPLGLSLAGALAMPSPSLFFTKTLPFLLGGQDAFALPWDASPIAVLPRLGVPAWVAVGVSFAGAAAGLWAVWARWRRGDEGPLRLAETSCAVMLAAFLVSRPSFDHYLLVVLPLLLVSTARVGAVARSVWLWVALVPQVGGVPWPGLSGKRRAFRDCFTLVVIAGTVVRGCLRPARVNLDDERTAGAVVPSARSHPGERPARAGARPAF